MRHLSTNQRLRGTMMKKRPSALGFWSLLLTVLLLATTATAREDQQLTDAPVSPPVAMTVAPVTLMPITVAPMTGTPVAAPVVVPVTDAPITMMPALLPSFMPFEAGELPSGTPSLLPSGVLSTISPSLSPSASPVTPSPVTSSPVNPAPITGMPVTSAPIVPPPVTSAPVSDAPITSAPVSSAPATSAPSTSAPVTSAPAMGVPVQTGSFAIRILSATDLMSVDTLETFRETVEVFLTEAYAVLEPPVSMVGVKVVTQLLLGDSTVEAGMTVEGMSDETVNMSSLALVFFGVKGEEFVALLQTTKDNYLEAITEVIPVDPNAPSSAPTMVPSVTTSDPPSLIPTITAEPSIKVLIPVSDRFAIQLVSVTTKMAEGNAETLRSTTEQWLGENYALLEQPINNITIQIVSQDLLPGSRRKLQTLLPLEVEMIIGGNFKPEEGKATEPDQVNLSKQSRQFFDTQGDKFVALLKEADISVEDEVYYANVNGVATVDEPDDIVSPGPTPTSGGSNDGDGGGFAIGAIIAIALCGTLAATFLGAMVYRRSRRNGALAGATRNSTSSAARASTASRTRNGERLNLDRGDTGSIAESDLQSRYGTETLGGADTMSYAYSLDHGIDPSVASGLNSDYGYGTAGGAVPMEIPMAGESNDEMEYDGGSKITRECFAPPGKLGIVIDTTVEGPVIHKVNAGSPLEGIVWPGDIIIAIDDVDTRALSAGDITALMTNNMNQRRKLTILSDAS